MRPDGQAMAGWPGREDVLLRSPPGGLRPNSRHEAVLGRAVSVAWTTVGAGGGRLIGGVRKQEVIPTVQQS